MNHLSFIIQIMTKVYILSCFMPFLKYRNNEIGPLALFLFLYARKGIKQDRIYTLVIICIIYPSLSEVHSIELLLYCLIQIDNLFIGVFTIILVSISWLNLFDVYVDQFKQKMFPFMRNLQRIMTLLLHAHSPETQVYPPILHVQGGCFLFVLVRYNALKLCFCRE